MDIGISRGEIDYVATNRDTDPRGIRSAGWCRCLAALDGRNWKRPAGTWRRCRLPVWVKGRNAGLQYASLLCPL